MVVTRRLGCGCVDRSLCLMGCFSTDAQAFELLLELCTIVDCVSHLLMCGAGSVVSASAVKVVEMNTSYAYYQSKTCLLCFPV